MPKLAVLIISFFCFLVCTQAQMKETGKASYYANNLVGKPTASGEIYKHELKTAAHKTLPFGTMVKVTNLNNDKSVVVKINDRGPFVHGRIIDLSKSASQEIGGVLAGIINVEIEVITEQVNYLDKQMTQPLKPIPIIKLEN